MSAVLQPAIQPATAREFLSGNEAVARGAFDAGVELAAAYPGTPSTEIVETLATFPGVYAEWSTNEKVALEVALGASMTGRRAITAMKHVGHERRLRLADDARTGGRQGRARDRRVRRRRLLLLAERAGLALLGPLRASSRARTLRRERGLCHDPRRVRALRALRGARAAAPDDAHFAREAHGADLRAGGARRRAPWLREGRGSLDHHAEPRREAPGSARRARRRARCSRRSPPAGTGSNPEPTAASVSSCPGPPITSCARPIRMRRSPSSACRTRCRSALARRLAASVDRVLVVEEVDPIVENELRAAGLAVSGKDVLPRGGEITVAVLRQAVARLTEALSPAA